VSTCQRNGCCAANLRMSAVRTPEI
jgi:hypothetical protein